jgi:single-stranded-DNA-specific exonuclease
MQESLHPVIQLLFNKKGFHDKEIQEFLSWDLKSIPDLTKLKDLDIASTRIINAINNKELIGIYGDYDVDGTTSCALFFHFFKMLNVEVKLFQPSRFVEGYGIHNSSIDNAKSEGVKVLITVDCGITAVETAKYSQAQNIDLIITDHHKDAAEITPPAFAVVNPNRRDEPIDHPLKTLAGVGVAFCLCVKIRQDLMASGRDIPSLYPLLSFVSIGTICDLAYLDNLNLRLTRHGLKAMQTTEYLGIKSFFAPEELEMKTIPSEKLAFSIGPMINSKGRLDHPDVALKLLIAPTRENARDNLFQLEICNRDRRIIQAQVFDQAKKEVIKEMNGEDNVVSFIFNETWHEGVIGIVASKLVETFGIPAVVLTNAEEKGVIKASVRSAGELNIFDCLKKCEDLFLKFGGHAAAAGFSIKKENLSELKARLKNVIAEYPHVVRTNQASFDLEINPEDINAKLLKDLELLEPFGMGNEKPVFRMKNIQVHSFRILKDAHVKWTFQSSKDPKIMLQGISFNYLSKWNEPSPDELMKHQKNQGIMVEFTLGINRFNGNEFIQLMVDKIRLGMIH